MLWLLTAVTTAALLLIAGFVKEISKVPTVAQPAALTATAHDTRHATASPSPSASAQVRDASSGLSYRLLSSPWQRGCPGVLDTPMFSWTAGEHAVAGRVSIGGAMIDWHGNACSGQLRQQFAYSGPADLEPVTMGRGRRGRAGLLLRAAAPPHASRAAPRCRSAGIRPGWSRS